MLLTTKFILILKIVERVINMKNITIEENTLVISCDGSSEPLTNEDIDLLISFLKNSKS